MKGYLSYKYPERETSYINKLSGAIINDLFGTPNPAEPFTTFVKENKACIAEEMNHIATEFEGMRIPLTDALRVQFLCDDQEGIDSSRILARAQELHILLVDREVPLPRHFLDLARKLGSAFGFLVPQVS